MIFVPGTSYYVLTPDQLADLLAMFEEDGYDPSSFDGDFSLAEDGNYYAVVGSEGLDEDELAYMDDWGFLNIFEYKKSTQSTSPI